MSAVSRQRTDQIGGHRPPLQFRQLELGFREIPAARFVGQALGLPERAQTVTGVVARQFPHGCAHELEAAAKEILRTAGAASLADELRVQWNAQLKSCAGRADFRHKLVSLNPRLAEHGSEEIDRTLRHELAHLLAQWRAGRRRIPPHGQEWRQACQNLGIGDEKRCHHLPFPTRRHRRRFLYQCPNCQQDFPRIRKIKRTVACLKCCRKHNSGEFDARFRLKLMTR